MYSVFSLALNVKMKILISAAQFDRGPVVPIGAHWCPVVPGDGAQNGPY